MRSTTWLCLSSILVVSTANAQTISNGGFETNNVGGTPQRYLYSDTGGPLAPSGIIAGPWSFSGDAGVTDSNTAWGGVAQEGQYFAFLQTANIGGSFSQTISGLTVGYSYNVSFYAKHRLGYGFNDISVTSNSGFVLSGFTPTEEWLLHTGTFQATATTATLTWSVPSMGASSGDRGSFIDNVSISAGTAPAPGAAVTMTLLAAGLCLAYRNRRPTFPH